ncbi:hypothetical protein [Hymenobacter crusticola]|uniref:Uncharacterized protein n=1 Tax=Hymenobacter crusticola TaxID=1770526 RepID=A0A243WGD1_9BACT|nr:hypothetical protein [Hymenobacter crusticola]OUJ74812.1 hypothetical protein BXP70_08635 [Hymenobacter crusticola]
MKTYAKLSQSTTRSQASTLQAKRSQNSNAIINNRPGSARQRQLQTIVAGQSIQQKQWGARMNKMTAPAQLMLCGEAVTDSNVAPLAKWQHNENTTVRLEAGKDDVGADRSWKLILAVNGTDKGTISLFYRANEKTFKPDNLEVPSSSDRDKGYGMILSKYAIKAINDVDDIKAIRIQSSKLELNLMNPISAYISMKELFSFYNGPESEEHASGLDGQVDIGQAALATFKSSGEKSKGFDVEKFPLFWAKLVSLAENNNVIFHNAALNDRNYTKENALAMLQLMARANIRAVKGFGLNVEASMNPSTQTVNTDMVDLALM